MPDTSDFLLYGLLGVIALLLLVAIIVMLRRSRNTPNDAQAVPVQITDPEPILFDPPPAPQLDPIDRYLGHLRSVSGSVEPLTGTEYLITIGGWSLPATLQLAQMSLNDSNDDNYSPTLRLYFAYHEDGSWAISDRGENAEVLRAITDQFQRELDSFRSQLARLQVNMTLDGILSTQGGSYRGFERALGDLCSAVQAMDDYWTPLIWEAEGPLPMSMLAEGETSEFVGRGTGYNYFTLPAESTHSFMLRKGVVVMTFEHNGGSGNDNELGEVHLVRDDPGMFDSKKQVCSFTGQYDMIGMWCVTEGMWRDPHPEVSYHIEVKAPGNWSCNIFQPNLGQSKGSFPHRAGLDSGATVVGPFRTGPNPIRANIQHSGSSEFFLEFISVDGTHDPEVLRAEGQIHWSERELDLLPGKEYLMCGYGNGAWRVDLIEGY